MSEHEDDTEHHVDLDRSSECSLSKDLACNSELNFLSQTTPLEPEDDGEHANVGHVPDSNDGESQPGQGASQTQSISCEPDREQSDTGHASGMLFLCEYCQGPITSAWPKKAGYPANQFCSKACALGKQSNKDMVGVSDEGYGWDVRDELGVTQSSRITFGGSEASSISAKRNADTIKKLQAADDDSEHNPLSTKGNIASHDDSKATDDEVSEKNSAVEPESNKPDSLWKPPVFDWEEYKKILDSRAAPLVCFGRLSKEVKGLTAGMKLEALDKNNPCNYCVATVIEVLGHRLRVRYDGFGNDDVQDFWANFQAEELFPIGWCAGNSYPLQPPSGITSTLEDWKTFLTRTLTGALAAPTELFRENDKRMQLKVHSFQVGMKVECIHPKKPGIICPATITKSLGPYYYQVTTEALPGLPSCTFYGHCESAGIFPFGWCAKNGVQLTLPAYVDTGGLSKEKYMAMGRSKSAPGTSLIKRSAKVNRFKVGQKLEAVDLEEPSSIRVATVFSVIGRIILLLFDGQGKFQYVDCESEDIFPTGWCFRTGHPLHTSYGIDPSTIKHSLVSGNDSGIIRTASRFHSESRTDPEHLYVPLKIHRSCDDDEYLDEEERCQCPRCERAERIYGCHDCSDRSRGYSLHLLQGNICGKRRQHTYCGRPEKSPRIHYEQSYNYSGSLLHRDMASCLERCRSSSGFSRSNVRTSSSDCNESSPWGKLCFPGYQRGKSISQRNFIDPKTVLSGNDVHVSGGNNRRPSLQSAEIVSDNSCDYEPIDSVDQRSRSPRFLSAAFTKTGTTSKRVIDTDSVLSCMDTHRESLEQRRIDSLRSGSYGSTELGEKNCHNNSALLENIIKIMENFRADVLTSLRKLEGNVRILDRRLDIIEERAAVQTLGEQRHLVEEQDQESLSRKVKRITRSCQVNIAAKEPQGRSRTKSSLQQKYSSLRNRKNIRTVPHSFTKLHSSTDTRNSVQSLQSSLKTSPLNTPATYSSSHMLPRLSSSTMASHTASSITVSSSPLIDLTTHSFVPNSRVVSGASSSDSTVQHIGVPSVVQNTNSLHEQAFPPNSHGRFPQDPNVQTVYTWNTCETDDSTSISAHFEGPPSSPGNPPTFAQETHDAQSSGQTTSSQSNPVSYAPELNRQYFTISAVGSANSISSSQNITEKRRPSDLSSSNEVVESVLERLPPEQVRLINSLSENQSMKRHEFALRLLDMFFTEEEQVHVSDPTGGCLKNLDGVRLRMIKGYIKKIRDVPQRQQPITIWQLSETTVRLQKYPGGFNTKLILWYGKPTQMMPECCWTFLSQ